MEELIIAYGEKSIVAGAFIFLLYYLVNTNTSAMKSITCNLESFGITLQRVSETLLKIDMRVEQLEQRIKDLEGDVKIEKL